MLVGSTAIAVLALFPNLLVADTYRCSKGLVSEESTVAEILAKCGAPASKDVREIQPTARTLNGTVQRLPPVVMEVWTYSRSPAMKVTILDGKLEKIEGLR